MACLHYIYLNFDYSYDEFKLTVLMSNEYVKSTMQFRQRENGVHQGKRGHVYHAND